MESTDLNIRTGKKINAATENADDERLTSDEDVMAISKHLIEKNEQAYEMLAK